MQIYSNIYNRGFLNLGYIMYPLCLLSSCLIKGSISSPKLSVLIFGENQVYCIIRIRKTIFRSQIYCLYGQLFRKKPLHSHTASTTTMSASPPCNTSPLTKQIRLSGWLYEPKLRAVLSISPIQAPCTSNSLFV